MPPRVYLVDTGFLDAKLVVASRDGYAVEMLGPTRRDHHRQAKVGEGFDAQQFQIDWEWWQATCPAGRTSIS